MQLLRKIAFPFSLVYAAVVCLRNRCYDYGIFSSTTFATPTLCVGNLSVGGTGKTPMVSLLIMLLRDTHHLAVLSRGYGRKTKGYRHVTPGHSASEVGDEPLQLASAFPEVTVVVDGNRRRGIRTLGATVNPDLILLDDAFQHRSVSPTRSILLTACHNLYADDRYLPAGTLRDCRDQSHRADLIVVTKCPPGLSDAEQEAIRTRLQPGGGQPVLFATLAYDLLLKGVAGTKPLEWLKGKEVTLVTGIADPMPLVAFLEGEGITATHMDFGDHHRFTAGEIARLGRKEYILTTEKDFMRLKGRLRGNVYYLRVRHEFLGDGLATLKGWLETL